MPEAPDGFVNSWLQGPFAPVAEEVTAYDLKVTGTIPAELEDGRLLRVGPNPIDPQNPVTYNWFTGNKVEVLDDQPQEMPRMDDRITGDKFRYGYFSSRDQGVSTLIKRDFDASARDAATETYAYGPGRFGMEAVFVPRTPDAAEDDGWLMTYVTDMTTRTADVVILPAQDLAAGPVATIHIPHRVPIGFHGNWIPDSEVAEQRRALGLD